MEKLISMTSFVLETKEWIKNNNKVEKDQSFTDSVAIDKMIGYAKFLKQPLKIGMFVPCDEDGNVLDVPQLKNYIFEDHKELVGNPKEYDKEAYLLECEQYQKAQEKVLFEGFEVEKLDGITCISLNKRIVCAKKDNEKDFVFNIEQQVEDLWKGIELTESALKQIGI